MDYDNILFFFPKVKKRLHLIKRRFWKYLDVEKESLKGYIPFEDALSFKIRLRAMLGRYDSELINRVRDNDKEDVIISANQALLHIFDLLGSGPVEMETIDWHSDFIRGKRWEKKFYCEIGSIKGADIKTPWELSRCQHFLWLGEAYLFTENDKYAQEVIAEINWWIDDNPLLFSVNWTCAMDVAFRAVNWIFALNMISGYGGFDDTFTNKVCKSLWQHGFFIRNNLEKSIPYSNNHYASDLVGLLYIGSLFFDRSKANKWKRYALSEFYDELLEQTLDSGIHYERSVSYHRLMTEMLSYPIYMLQRLGEKVPIEIINRVKSMYDYVSNYTKPNGLSPLVADNDNGRFVPFKYRDFRRHGYLNDQYSIENVFVSYGANPQFISRVRESRLYDDAGVAIVHMGGTYLFVNSGGYSRKPDDSKKIIGTHTHNDSLSFEYSIGNKDIVVDAGTFTYTMSEDIRNEFRSTVKHNTIVVDDEEQNGFVDPFILSKNIEHRKISFFNNSSVEGEYKTIKSGMRHMRRFELTERGLSIKDIVLKKGGNHTADIYYHFKDGLEPIVVNNDIVLSPSIKISFSLIPDNISIYDDTISPSYGIIMKAKSAKVSFSFKDRIEICSYFENVNN